VGVGEASFISLAAPFIDDNAPAAQRTAWLGIFYMLVGVGEASFISLAAPFIDDNAPAAQ
nr:probable sphingolipid transporter spinster homolog 2 [Tanacetum cinerariifolium]